MQKCKKSKLTRICALQKYLNVSIDAITTIVSNRYDFVASVNINNTTKHFVVITEARFNTINKRIAYPERFSVVESKNYRSKIITGHKDAIEIRVEFDKSQIFYIYKLPIIIKSTNKKHDKYIDNSDLIEAALLELESNEYLIDQFNYKLRKICKELITEAFKEGQLSIINSQ